MIGKKKASFFGGSGARLMGDIKRNETLEKLFIASVLENDFDLCKIDLKIFCDFLRNKLADFMKQCADLLDVPPLN